MSTTLVAAQLALLAWLVLFQVVTDSAESRGNEVALAKLRGFSGRSTVAFGLGQPVAVLAAAVPVGLLVAWAAVAGMSRWVLVPGTPVQMTWTAVLGALVGFTGAVVGAALAARRVLTRPVLEQWRKVPDVQHGAASLVLDVVLFVGALAGLVALRANGAAGTAPRPISLIAPGLLVLAVALLGVRLLPYVGRAALGPTRASPRIGSFLAVRQVLRRPAGLRLAALLAVAVGLATFAIDGEAVAAANRDTRAGVEVGAPTVLTVQYEPTHDPVAVTHAVDPQGRWAMAAATLDRQRRRAHRRAARGGHQPAGRGGALAGRLGASPPPTRRPRWARRSPRPISFTGTAVRAAPDHADAAGRARRRTSPSRSGPGPRTPVLERLGTAARRARPRTPARCRARTAAR